MKEIRFRKNLKRLLAEKNKTPRQMSIDLEIGTATAYFYLRSDTMPRIDVAGKIADYFNITLDELVFGEG